MFSVLVHASNSSKLISLAYSSQKKMTKGLTHFESYAILHGSSLSMCTAVVSVDGEEETVSTAITCTQCDLQAATLRERVQPTSITLRPELATNHCSD